MCSAASMVAFDGDVDMKYMGVSLCQSGALSLYQAVSLEGQNQGCPQLQLIKSKTKRIQ